MPGLASSGSPSANRWARRRCASRAASSPKLRTLAGRSVGGFGGEGACGGSDDEPLGGAGDAAQETATFGGLQGGVAFASQGCGLQFLIGQVGLRGGEPGLASLAIEGEVVEWFQILRGQDGFMGRRGVREELARHWAGRRG